MKGYKSKADRAWRLVDQDYPKDKFSEEERKRVFKQYLAKFIVGITTTIGGRKNDKTGKTDFYLIKQNSISKPHIP